MTTDPKRKVFIVDDHPLVREWLTSLINQQPDLVVCGEASDRAHALSQIEAARPDAAVVDISLENSSGIELIKDLKAIHPELAVLVLTMHEEALYAERALRAGARGYVMKRAATRQIVVAIRKVLAGELYISDKVASAMTESYVTGRSGKMAFSVDLLSDRELEVFRLFGQGCDTRRIADTLHVSIKTVQAHYARMKEKLGLSSVTELVREAVRWEERRIPR